MKSADKNGAQIWEGGGGGGKFFFCITFNRTTKWSLQMKMELTFEMAKKSTSFVLYNYS